MKTNELRSAFLKYFEKQGHTIISSGSLVPANDPTLLFINAGMAPLKDVFLGKEKRPYVRATSSQKCVRAGGKHNDLDQVGFTTRHQTFFEMLGNFSFGDYFKREAIQFAWELLTTVLKIPAEKLWVTVFKEDDEAADIWLNEIKVDPNRFSRCGEKDNFWAMGDTGPCGPCSEIFYDHGETVPGGPPGSPDEEGDRYVEIWNLVFMQYNRDSDGNLNPLPKPSIDTGMGLERIAAVIQGVHSNYDIDLFKAIIQVAAKLTGAKDLESPSLRVIADHIRAATFLITDGVMPSNEGRGYVLRRIIRRAIRHGNKLGCEEPFFYKLVAVVVEEMGDAYPDIKKSQKIIEKILLQEEEQFAKTLQQGLKVFEEAVIKLTGNVMPGDVVFKLYDTYGFPVDLTEIIAKELGYSIDLEGFEKAMQRQRKQSQAASHFDVDYHAEADIGIKSKFMGYESTTGEATVAAILTNRHTVEKLSAGEKGSIVLDVTPFYAESGGQVGDTGELKSADGLFIVEDTQKLGEAIAHVGYVKEGVIKQSNQVTAAVNAERRHAIALNHSATHLLHTALRQVLGDHVAQRGSLVDGKRLRFDFSHFQPMTQAELQQIEAIVSQAIKANHSVATEEMQAEEAINQGAMALFGEKYGERVRVLTMSDFSKELCGGTHAEKTGDIKQFKIVSERGIAAGIRRIEAITEKAVDTYQQQVKADEITKREELLKIHEEKSAMIKQLGGSLEQVVTADMSANDLQQIIKTQEKQIQKLQQQLATTQIDQLIDQVVEVNGIKVLSTEVKGVDVKSLRDMLDQLKDKLHSGVIVLAVVKDDQTVHLVAGVTKDLTSRFHAGQLVKIVAEQVGGKGGGRPDMAQGGGNQPENLVSVLKNVPSWIKNGQR